jgi:hypothetical protein
MLRKMSQPWRWAAAPSVHPLYHIWKGMLARCEDPGIPGYAYYGAKGITVCERWHELQYFAEDIESSIGPRPEGKTATGHPLYTLDRIDGKGNYEPGNVRWADWVQQAANRSRPAHWKEKGT